MSPVQPCYVPCSSDVFAMVHSLTAKCLVPEARTTRVQDASNTADCNITKPCCRCINCCLSKCKAACYALHAGLPGCKTPLKAKRHLHADTAKTLAKRFGKVLGISAADILWGLATVCDPHPYLTCRAMCHRVLYDWQGFVADNSHDLPCNMLGQLLLLLEHNKYCQH